METGNKPHPIVPKKLRVIRNDRGDWVIILDSKAIEGEYRVVESKKKNRG